MTTLIDTHIAAALSPDYDFPYDLFIGGAVMGKMLKATQKNYDFALKTLYNRATFQIQTLHVFKTLKDEGFIAEDALRDYINVTPYNSDIRDNVHNTTLLLRCFDRWTFDRFMEERGPDDFFDNPIIWLAVAIIRSSIDYAKLFDYLTDSKILGTLKSGKLTYLEQHNEGVSTITHDPKVSAQRDGMGSGRKSQLYGYALPSGVGEGNLEEAIDACLRELDGYRTFGEEYFGGVEECAWERMSSSEGYFEDVIDLTETFFELD